MLGNQIALAPMEGVSDFPVRVWFALTSGPPEMSTPFLRVTESYPHKELPATYLPELTQLRGRIGYRLIPQLMASDATHFLRAAAQVLEVSPYVDLNCGCPAPSVVGHGAGSSILKDPDSFGARLTWLARQLGPGRLSVKMRTGFSDDARFNELLDGLEGIALRHVTIHGRSRAQRYLGKADWQHIDTATRRLKVPVVGSGDINSLSCLHERRRLAPHVKTFFIGRGALRNPWIFSLLRGDMQTVALNYNTLVHAFGVLALLLDSHFTKPNLLIDAVGKHLPEGPIGVDSKKWSEFFENICRSLASRNSVVEALEIERRTLGRIKMHWSYLRSSLAQEFFDPGILRARNWNEFCERLESAFKSHYGLTGSDMVTLSYQSQLDWIYAGGRRPEG